MKYLIGVVLLAIGAAGVMGPEDGATILAVTFILTVVAWAVWYDLAGR